MFKGERDVGRAGSRFQVYNYYYYDYELAGCPVLDSKDGNVTDKNVPEKHTSCRLKVNSDTLWQA